MSTLKLRDESNNNLGEGRLGLTPEEINLNAEFKTQNNEHRPRTPGMELRRCSKISNLSDSLNSQFISQRRTEIQHDLFSKMNLQDQNGNQPPKSSVNVIFLKKICGESVTSKIDDPKEEKRIEETFPSLALEKQEENTKKKTELISSLVSEKSKERRRTGSRVSWESSSSTKESSSIVVATSMDGGSTNGTNFRKHWIPPSIIEESEEKSHGDDNSVTLFTGTSKSLSIRTSSVSQDHNGNKNFDPKTKMMKAVSKVSSANESVGGSKSKKGIAEEDEAYIEEMDAGSGSFLEGEIADDKGSGGSSSSSTGSSSSKTNSKDKTPSTGSQKISKLKQSDSGGKAQTSGVEMVPDPEGRRGAILFKVPGRLTHKTTIKVSHFPQNGNKNGDCTAIPTSIVDGDSDCIVEDIVPGNGGGGGGMANTHQLQMMSYRPQYFGNYGGMCSNPYYYYGNPYMRC